MSARRVARTRFCAAVRTCGIMCCCSFQVFSGVSTLKNCLFNPEDRKPEPPPQLLRQPARGLQACTQVKATASSLFLELDSFFANLPMDADG